MAETNALSLFPYAADLFGGMVDLLQLESVPATASLPKQPAEPNPGDREEGKGFRKAKAEDNREADEEDEETEPTSQLLSLTMDTHPTMANSKFPPLRRAALHFLVLLIRACISRVYDMGSMGMLVPGTYLKRARATLGYVASTDEDAIVRIMAREAGEGLGQLSNALVGL